LRLLELAHERFRNLSNGCTTLAPATTVLLGDNGQGKTSFLEGIGVLATTRSFRKAKSSELPRHGERSFFVRGKVEDSRATSELSLVHEDGKRTTRIGRTVVELGEYVSMLSVIAITQAHAGIVRGSPQERRDFLDRGILGLHPGYLQSLANWRRSLKQKNALLRRDGLSHQSRELQAWNERLAKDAAEVMVRRRAYALRLSEVLNEVGPLFLPAGEVLSLDLQDALSRRRGESESPPLEAIEDRETLSQALLERMDEQAARELASRQCLVGPHRDDLLLSTSGKDLRRYASSGQQRNALLALKMAKVELHRELRRESPVLLVDDVDTEIDPARLQTFLRHVGGRAQALITSSKRDLFGSPPEDSLFYDVRDGTLTPT
jgi:DNA replication and repair protein RecF